VVRQGRVLKPEGEGMINIKINKNAHEQKIWELTDRQGRIIMKLMNFFCWFLKCINNLKEEKNK